MFNSTMANTSPPHQSQMFFCNPNPNFDQVTYATHHHINGLQYLRDVSNYLMSDEGLEDNLLLQNRSIVLDSTTMNEEHCNKSSTSVPLALDIKCRRKEIKYTVQEEFRLAFRTKSNYEFMDDGFKWRKYGKKMVKGSPNPRNYFKCSSGGCNVKKRVERDREDPSYVITTYEGVHNHVTPTCVLHCTPHHS